MSAHGIQIRQQELQDIYELDRDIAQKQERVDQLKSNLKALLFEKMPVESGRFDARLIFRTVHHPAWKQAVIENLGPEFAESFRKSSSSSRLCEVLVEEHAVPPLWRQTMDASGSES
jgi:hypothetical protein